MSFKDELRSLHKEWGEKSLDKQILAMEAFIAADSIRNCRVLCVLRRAMCAAARHGAEYCEIEYEEPTAADEEAMLVFEDWLETHDYDFHFTQERREGRRHVTLSIHLWLD